MAKSHHVSCASAISSAAGWEVRSGPDFGDILTGTHDLLDLSSLQGRNLTIQTLHQGRNWPRHLKACKFVPGAQQLMVIKEADLYTWEWGTLSWDSRAPGYNVRSSLNFSFKNILGLAREERPWPASTCSLIHSSCKKHLLLVQDTPRVSCLLQPQQEPEGCTIPWTRQAVPPSLSSRLWRSAHYQLLESSSPWRLRHQCVAVSDRDILQVCERIIFVSTKRP